MRRWLLSKKDRRRLREAVERELPGLEVPGHVEVIVEDGVKLYLFEDIPALIEDEELGRLVPHLMYLLRRGYNWLPVVIVDEGAVKPISRGADLMRPGIVETRGQFGKGGLFVVVEPSRGLPLAVHEALYSSEEVLAMEKGRVSRSLHHVGDKYWKLGQQL